MSRIEESLYRVTEVDYRIINEEYDIHQLKDTVFNEFVNKVKSGLANDTITQFQLEVPRPVDFDGWTYWKFREYADSNDFDYHFTRLSNYDSEDYLIYILDVVAWDSSKYNWDQVRELIYR